MQAAFQDRENLYLLLNYIEAGDLRHYINLNVSFNEHQISNIRKIKNSSFAASSTPSRPSTAATSSTAISNQKTSSLTNKATPTS